MNRASAFCPAGISSFFQAVTTDSTPQTMEEAALIGARGGGFILDKGVHTDIAVESAKTTEVEVTINDQLAPDAKVTHEVCRQFLNQVEDNYQIRVNHQVEVPIGAGYGASAAGAVSTAMALARVFGMNLSLNQIGQIAHFAEIRCATGLGSVSGVIRGGMILILEPGAPGYDRVDWIPFPPSYRIVTASLAPIPKEDIIFSKKALKVVNHEGRRVLNQILSNPSPTEFMKLCNGFARKVGFLSKRIAKVLDDVMDAGAVGATQNMIGDAFHAVVHIKDLKSVVQTVADIFPSNAILVSELSYAGPRHR